MTTTDASKGRFSTRLRARVARAAINLVAFAGGGLAAYVLSDDALGLVGNNATLLAVAVGLQPVLSQTIGNYAGKVRAWLATQE